MQLRWIYLYGKLPTKQQQDTRYKKAVKDRSNREWSTRRHEDMFPAVPSFWGEVRLRLEGCGWYPAPLEASPYSPVNLATKGLVHLHYRFLQGGTEALISSLGHTSTTELEAPKSPQSVTIQSKAYQIETKAPRVSKETLRARGPQVNEGEIQIASVRM